MLLVDNINKSWIKFRIEGTDWLETDDKTLEVLKTSILFLHAESPVDRVLFYAFPDENAPGFKWIQKMVLLDSRTIEMRYSDRTTNAFVEFVTADAWRLPEVSRIVDVRLNIQNLITDRLMIKSIDARPR